jgi:hypothetical protein
MSGSDVQFGYDRTSQRYRDLSTGRWVSERSVRDAVDNVADHASRLMGDAAARFRAGTIDAGQWLAESMQTSKTRGRGGAGGLRRQGQHDAPSLGHGWERREGSVPVRQADGRRRARRPAKAQWETGQRGHGCTGRRPASAVREHPAARGRRGGLPFEANVRHSSEAARAASRRRRPAWCPSAPCRPSGLGNVGVVPLHHQPVPDHERGGVGGLC